MSVLPSDSTGLKFVCLSLNLSIWPFKPPSLLLQFLAPVLTAQKIPYWGAGLQPEMSERILMLLQNYSGVTGAMDGHKGLALWISLWEEGPLGKFRNTGRRAVPVTRNPTKAQFRPGLVQSLARLSPSHQRYWKPRTSFPVNYCFSLLLVLLLVLADCDANQNQICRRSKPADLCSLPYPFCLM